MPYKSKSIHTRDFQVYKRKLVALGYYFFVHYDGIDTFTHITLYHRIEHGTINYGDFRSPKHAYQHFML